jgi:hypothetical protein
MKQNITLAVDKDLLKKARVLAAKRETSVSRLLSEQNINGLLDSSNH